MLPLNQIFAKSINYGALTLLEHTQQVTEAIDFFARNYENNFDIEIARKGAIIHDLGKAHPYFQRKIRNINSNNLSEKRAWDYIHRHEISSLAFLKCFPTHEWNSLIDLVVAHHKSIENDPTKRGILDLIESDRYFIENHLKDWDTWSSYGFEILSHFGIQKINISFKDAKETLEYVINYCENKSNGFSPLRGLLKSADHFASAFTFETKNQLLNLFQKPILDYFHSDERISPIYPLSTIPFDDNRIHTIVVAPTGAGKTDFLLKRCNGRIFYTLPFQASINAMYERIKSTVPNKDIRLLHATSKIVSKNSIDEQILQPLAGSCIKILTPHQLAAIIFGTSGYETVILDVQGTDVILDEIHTYSDISRTMILEIVKTLLRFGCRIHIGTATMPSILYNELLNILGGNTMVYEVKLPPEIVDTFDRHRIDKIDDISDSFDILIDAMNKKEKVLVVLNTINYAQEYYKTIEGIEAFKAVPKMLIHSRYKREDRVGLELKLKKEFNGDGSDYYGNGFMPCIVVSTQVVEVSLDISFDRMITQCAPIDSMIQRFGRVNRKRSFDTIGKYKVIHVIKPSGNVLPYKLDILQASYDQLPNNLELLKERSLQSKIDIVYPTVDTKEIDIHLIFKNGKYIIRELTNNKKAVLVEALEIESATCILSTDRDKYLSSNWEERQNMEIPINFKVIARHKSKFEQLEVGSYPFVVPQNIDDYDKYGLQFIEHETIL